eukprot:GFUD01110296.1.p1 GENE.GFUD01110296.1~~GFUD01110296.1.p1  ORF type:complete len:145 (+),score=27.58 GFUD01110296.1:206-640(+)
MADILNCCGPDLLSVLVWRMVIRPWLLTLGRHVPLSPQHIQLLPLQPVYLVRQYNINAQERICSLVNRAKVVIFIRGTEARPECEDSKELVKLLLVHRARFDVVNVLTDYNAEMGIREYTGDTRIPLVFFKGELVGSTEEIPPD